MQKSEILNPFTSLFFPADFTSNLAKQWSKSVYVQNTFTGGFRVIAGAAVTRGGTEGGERKRLILRLHGHRRRTLPGSVLLQIHIF